ncbi:MAG: hypothetical protein K0U98_16800 [Deltaproteobacteria bacterium]|nr:hypothetical protein [Deltaproteobacteria bacterium]
MKNLVWWLGSSVLAISITVPQAFGIGVRAGERIEGAVGESVATSVDQVDSVRAESEKTYPIQLYRGTKVGARFHMTATASLTNTETLFDGDESLGDQSQSGKIRLEADGTVLAVDEDGGITQAEYLVVLFEAQVDGQPVAGLSPGQVVETKSVGATTEILLQEGELTPTQSFFLSQVLETANQEDTRDDVIFGTSEPQALGGHWDISKESTVEELAKNYVAVEEEDLEGGTHLVAIREIAGVPCLYLEGTLEASPFVSASMNPEGKLGSRLALSFTGCYPLDLERMPLSGHISSYSSVRNQIGVEEGVPVILRRVSESEKDFTLRPFRESSAETPSTETDAEDSQ